MKKVQMFFLAAFAIAGFMLLARPAKLMAATTAAGECPRGKSEIKVMHGVMEKDETWTSDHVYMVIGRRSTGKHTLNIEAGTTVCFTTGPMDVGSPRGNISVDGGGTLNINGTAQNHVTLTRWYDLSVGEVEWMGIDYGADVKKPGTVQYADFYYAGSSGAGFKTFG
ncbi:MAG: hypothetical protein OEV66_09635, partial [Spirochaetia bacterium]|nr:hypothetical protein [Spirochaetia bacterium]